MDVKGPEWTCGEVLQLIDEYGRRPALWDTTCEDYKNRCKKHEMWLELADIFKCGKLEVERKMKILNSQYRRERLKAVRMRKAGMSHRVTWYGFKGFAFLSKLAKRAKNGAEAIKEEKDEEESAPAEVMPFVDAQDDHTTESGPASYVNDEFCEADLNGENEVTQKDGGMAKVLGERDEWAIFGELVALVFRRLPDDRTRCIAKHRINTVLYEAELASYNSASYNG